MKGVIELKLAQCRSNENKNPLVPMLRVGTQFLDALRRRSANQRHIKHLRPGTQSVTKVRSHAEHGNE